jgi:hypothetical protein
MTNPLPLHPTELAYVLSYMKTNMVIGWGTEPFKPTPANKDAFFADGLDRLKAAMRLVVGKQPARFRFTDEISEITSTLAEPQIVLVTNRQAEKGVRVMTHHIGAKRIVQLTLDNKGIFQVVQYDSLTGAAGAATAFVGAAAKPVKIANQVQAAETELKTIKELARRKASAAEAALTKLGFDNLAASSVTLAFSKPAASGIINVLYCTGNFVQDSDSYAVLTNFDDESWTLFSSDTAPGQMMVERTSVGSLAARITVTTAARITAPA